MSSYSDKRIPRVAIVGRPNVGKSTIFNRICKKRIAITDPTPGVTRDAVEYEIEMDGRRFLLVDTGGWKAQYIDKFDDIVAKKSEEVIKTADIILFILDIREDTPEDEHFIELLRPHLDRVIVVANKADTPDKDSLAWNYYSYGFSSIHCVSAAHNRNIGELFEVLLDAVDFMPLRSLTHEEDKAEIRLAVLGKPNAGKSTLTNFLTDSERSLVSPIPGTTRDILTSSFESEGTRFSITDTAGIRKKKRVSENVEYYSVNRAIASIKDSDVILLMIDSQEGLSEQDKKIASQIVKNGKGVILVLNKADTMGNDPEKLKAVENRVRFMFPILDFAPLLSISALKGKGMKPLLKACIKIQKQRTTKIETPQLNEALREWIDFNPPPIVKGKPLKLKYLTQVSVAPVKFILFSTIDKGFPSSYLSYIRNQIRKEFKLNSIPFEIEPKLNRNRASDKKLVSHKEA